MAGYEQEGAQRAGHIPGAASVPWAQAVKEDGTFKSADELRELYGGKGVTDGDAIIAYCRIGERSAHTWFVLHELLGEATSRTTTARGPSGATWSTCRSRRTSRSAARQSSGSSRSSSYCRIRAVAPHTKLPSTV